MGLLLCGRRGSDVPTPTPFDLIGGSYEARSKNFDAQRTVNLYPETSGSGTSKSIAMLIGTPGKRLLLTLPKQPVRGLLRVSPSLAFAVGGNKLYRLNTSWVATEIGTIDNDATLAYMASNGRTVMLVTGNSGYFIDLTTFVVTTITDPDFTGADRVDYLDGYFIWNKPGTQIFQVTQLLSTTIDTLDFASAEGAPDLLISQVVDHREYWAFGETTTQVFTNTGGSDFPLEAVQGVFFEAGCAAKYSPAKLDRGIFWLSADDRGQGVVLRTLGYQESRVSDHALEYAIARMSRIDDAIGWTYQQEGHRFYVLTFPSAEQTWAYDTSTQLWCERAYLDPSSGDSKRDRAHVHMAFNGENVVGDWENGKIYALDLDYYTDDGDAIQALRQAPHIAQGDAYVRHWEVWIDMQTGVGLDGGVFGSDPQAMLAWSNDHGHSFTDAMLYKIGRIGEYMVRARFQRLGMARDRVYRLTITDPVKRVLIAGGLRADQAAA